MRRVSLEGGDIVCGYVGVVQKALTLLGIPKPRLQCWPDELAQQLGRRVWRSTLGEVRGLDPPLFLKPALEDKAFPRQLRAGPGAVCKPVVCSVVGAGCRAHRFRRRSGSMIRLRGRRS